jgi:hypothetical protein
MPRLSARHTPRTCRYKGGRETDEEISARCKRYVRVAHASVGFRLADLRHDRPHDLMKLCAGSVVDWMWASVPLDGTETGAYALVTHGAHAMSLLRARANARAHATLARSRGCAARASASMTTIM